MEFDERTLRPTYRLLAGIPGRSQAFAIAERYGLDPAVIARAREQRTIGEERFDRLMEQLEHERAEAAAERREVAAGSAAILGWSGPGRGGGRRGAAALRGGAREAAREARRLLREAEAEVKDALRRCATAAPARRPERRRRRRAGSSASRRSGSRSPQRQRRPRRSRSPRGSGSS